MEIYIAASWKHQHAVEMLTALLRQRKHTVLSFVENNHGEQKGHEATKDGKPMAFDDWVWSERGEKSFDYDTRGATKSNLVIYISPSGQDAAAEVGAAWASGVKVLGLYAKGEGFGLMRRMVEWKHSYQELLACVDALAGVSSLKCKKRVSDHTDLYDCDSTLPCPYHGTTGVVLGR